MPSKVTDNKNTSLEDIFTTPKNFTSFKKFMKMKEFQRSEFLQKHIVDLRVVCPSRQKSCHMSSERIGTLQKWTDKNLNNSFEEWILKNNTSYKNFDALFSKYFTKIYRVFNFRTEETGPSEWL